MSIPKHLLAICTLFIACLDPVAAERMLPDAPRAASKLVVVNWQLTEMHQRTHDLSVRTLQGLVNRKRPRIWVNIEEQRPGRSRWWLDKYREMGIASTYPEELTSEQFLQRYKHYAKGVVIPPTNLGDYGYRVAVMRAATDDLIVGTRELAERLGLDVTYDYSTRFRTYAESWRYALDELWPKLSHDAILVDRYELRTATSTVDYVVQHKLFLCGPRSDQPEEIELFKELVARMPDNAAVMGSPGGGNLWSEGDIVRTASKTGKVFVGCDQVENMSVHAGLMPVPKLTQPMRTPPKLDPEKAYIAIEISDGDNASTWFSHIPTRRLWENRGRIPLGWTICQGTFELSPAATKYYYDTRTELDEFIAGVSGYIYMFPGDFGNGLSPQHKETAWDRFLNRTDRFLETSDIRVLTTIHYQEAPGPAGEEVFRRYAGLKNADGIINGYNAVYQEYDGKTWEMYHGLPVYHTLTDRTGSEPGQKTIADDVIERTPKERPAFVTLFMLPMVLHPDKFEQVVESLESLKDKGFEIVLPSELIELHRQALEQGLLSRE